MELCANRALLSNIPLAPHCRLLPPTPVNRRFRPSLLRLHSNSGDVLCKRSSPRAAMSEEAPSERSKFDVETSSRTAVVEDVPPPQRNTFNHSVEEETRPEDSTLDEQMPQFGQLLDKLNLKLDTEDSYSLFLYGGGALVSLWLLSAVVGAIDSIPVFPKLMEVVGLSYSVWFTTRYLIFKENRDELVAKIEELKQQVVGSDKEK